MEKARLESRCEAASAAARELEARAEASADALASAQQAQRDAQAQVQPMLQAHAPDSSCCIATYAVVRQSLLPEITLEAVSGRKYRREPHLFSGMSASAGLSGF